MQNFLKFDIFTVNSFFQYEANKKVASYPGLFFSILVFMFLFYTFMISDMVQKTNPKTSDIITADPIDGVTFELSSKNFYPIISITDENSNSYQYFDPKIWNVEFKIISFFDESSLIFENCSSGNLCLSESSHFIINQNSLILFQINICINSTDVICLPSAEIYSFLEKITFTLYFNDNTYNLNNYENPVNKSLSRVVLAYLNPVFSEMYSIDFKDSKNVLYVEFEVHRYYQQDYKSSNFAFFNRNGKDTEQFKKILSVVIDLSPNKRVISRKYQGLAEILGQLGGLLSICRLFGSIFLSIFPYLKIRKAFFKKLYVIPEEVKNEKDLMKIEEVEKEQRIENSIFSMIQMIPLSSYLRRDEENDNSKENFRGKQIIENQNQQKKNFNNKEHLLHTIENLKTRVSKNEKYLEFSFYSYFKNKFKSFLRISVDFEGQIILNADQIYEKETDIILLLKRLQDVEKLKCILLNKEQRILFDLIKPKIKTVSSNSPNEKNSDFSEIMTETLDINNNVFKKAQEIRNVLSIYEERIRDRETKITKIDRSILESL